MRRLGLVLLTSILLFFSCRSPLEETNSGLPSSGAGSITVSLTIGNAARTVVPDYAAQLETVQVTLVSNDGYAPLSMIDTAFPWEVSFTDVRAGSWDIEVVAEKGGVQIGSGSAANQAVAAGGVLTVPIALTLLPTGTSGDVNFTVSFPAATSIDYASGTIEETGNVNTPAISIVGGMCSATFAFTSLPEGTYSLVLTFRRGGPTGTSAGTFREKVIVRSGFTSGAWVATDGSLVSERTYSTTDFFDDSSWLSDLTVSGVFESGFTSTTTDYALGALAGLPAATSFKAGASVPGQYLRYYWNGAGPYEIAPGTASPDLTVVENPDPAALGRDNTLQVVVTAPDRVTVNSYTVTFSKGYTVSYDGNGSTGGTVPVDPSRYEAGQTVTLLGPADLVLSGYAFIGWTTPSDPIPYSPGTLFTMPAGDTVFYAVWQLAATVTVDVVFDVPSYGTITFTSPATVARGSVLSFTTNTLAGATNWTWYVDNNLVSSSAPPFNWDTTGLQPGQYAINVSAVYLGQPCTGSTVVTVTY